MVDCAACDNLVENHIKVYDKWYDSHMPSSWMICNNKSNIDFYQNTKALQSIREFSSKLIVLTVLWVRQAQRNYAAKHC
jgi:hypothetical protein